MHRLRHVSGLSRAFRAYRAQARAVAASVSWSPALLGALLGGVVLAAPAAADDRPSPIPEERREAVAEIIRARFAEQNELSLYPLPPLEEDDLSDVLDGDIVRLRTKWVLPTGGDHEGEEEQRERHRVLAFMLLPRSQEVTWLAAIDPHFLGNSRLSEARLEMRDSTAVWYQLLDPPWPAKNRHWVIDVVLPTSVAERSDDRVWEIRWALKDGGERIAMEATAAGLVPDVPLERAKKSRYLEANTGAWSIFAIDDELTLVAYQLTVVMGGWIPDRLTARFAKGALKELFESVEAATAEIAGHYHADHEPIPGGHGRLIAPYAPTPAVADADPGRGGTDSLAVGEPAPVPGRGGTDSLAVGDVRRRPAGATDDEDEEEYDD